ncbi:Zinc finger BED domain-containing protein 1 [Larimichthys crocea]|uniref:Zinc finger BED domain-containing protein 1 n=1 Tax=Larimichthys crocea TaxID=215358 RepID=A0A6G0HI21_LARCR|nr:Zinc finger BED domain-containing protein 1 [Larimichthys crocea]
MQSFISPVSKAILVALFIFAILLILYVILWGGTTDALQIPRRLPQTVGRVKVTHTVVLGSGSVLFGRTRTHGDVAAVGSGAARQAVSVRSESSSLSDVQQIFDASRYSIGEGIQLDCLLKEPMEGKSSGPSCSGLNLVAHPRAKSKVWKYFGFDTDADGCILHWKRIYCRVCMSQIAYSGNTSNLSYHLEKNHPVEFSEYVKSNTDQMRERLPRHSPG